MKTWRVVYEFKVVHYLTNIQRWQHVTRSESMAICAPDLAACYREALWALAGERGLKILSCEEITGTAVPVHQPKGEVL